VKKISGADRTPEPADAANFVLPARMQRLLGRTDGEAVRLYRVDFEKGARTNWHTHDDIQVLVGLDGRCVVVNRDGERLGLEPGDVVVVAGGEEHWHGAAAGRSGAHLAINLGGHTEWLESTASEDPSTT